MKPKREKRIRYAKINIMMASESHTTKKILFQDSRRDLMKKSKIRKAKKS